MTPTTRVQTPDVLVIGGGPAGLTAAAKLAPHVSGPVLVLEREPQAGGIPRHSDHPGYGIRDLHTFISGPAYARRLVRAAEDAGALVHTRSMVTGWDPDGAAQVTSPDGRYAVHARATILATGARERPRSARRIPGDRPSGIYTTGHLQNLVHLHHQTPGSRAVVVGAELVSWSAVMTLREAGCATVAMVTSQPRAESYAAVTFAGQLGLRTTVRTRTRVVAIHGQGRVAAVEIEHLDTGQRQQIPCDTVVFTGDWIPDNELARMAGLELDPRALSPLVDTALHTTRPGFFAAGNLVHPVDTADVCALDGAHVAAQVRAWLSDPEIGQSQVRLQVAPPLLWVQPSILRPAGPAPARSRLLLATSQFVRFPTVSVTQAGREIGRARTPWPADPGRIFRVPARVLDRVDYAHGDISLRLSS